MFITGAGQRFLKRFAVAGLFRYGEKFDFLFMPPMQPNFFILLLLSGGTIFAGCRSTSQSQIAAATSLSKNESIDLRSYRATEDEMKLFKDELGERFTDEQKRLQNMRKLRGETSDTHQLSEEEKVSIYYYTGSGFKDVNLVLQKSDLEGISKQAMFIKVLSSAINKLPYFEGTVYRSGNLPDYQSVNVLRPGADPTKVDPKRLAQFKVGEVIKYKSFMSTTQLSLGQLAQLGFLCREAEYTIHAKYGHDITSYSVSRGEKEVLFAPGSEFKIKKIGVSTPPANRCTTEVVQIELDEI